MSTCTRIAKDRAKDEIFSVLAKDMRISAEQMDSILARHGVKRSPKELQRTYRLSVAQQMMAGVRDTKGQREILALRSHGGTEYIVLEACHDRDRLDAIRHRLLGQIAGLEQTAEKVERRSGVFGRMFTRRATESRWPS